MKVEKHVRVKCPFCRQWTGTTRNGAVIARHYHMSAARIGTGVYAFWEGSSILCEGSYKSIVELEALASEEKR